MRPLAATVLLAAALAATPARGANPRLAPLPRALAVSVHGPYGSGACDACHERADPHSPGRPRNTTDALCFECHDDFRSGAPVRMDKRLHPTEKAACTTCHNPHNARRRKLLL